MKAKNSTWIPQPDVKIAAQVGGKKTVSLRKRSLADYIAAMSDTPADSGCTDLSSLSKRSDWSGTDSLAQYELMLRDGWPEGIVDAEGLDGTMTDVANNIVFQDDVAGAFPIVPAYLAGRPDCMSCPTMQKTDRTRSVTLVFDGSFNAGVKGETVLAYAKNVMALVAHLQAARIEVQIEMAIATTRSGKRYLYTCTIREQGTITAPERIAAILHPSWLRRAWFALVEREYFDHGIVDSRVCKNGFGSARTPSVEELRGAFPDTQSVILLPKVGSGDPTAAVESSLNLKLRT